MDSEKYIQVSSWLEEVFDGKPVPQFEIDPETVAALDRLRITCQKNDHYADMIIADIQRKCLEYSAETQYYRQVFERLHVKPDDLSSNAQANLRILTDLALTLDINDTSDYSYLLAMTTLKRQSMQLATTRKRVLFVGGQLHDKTKTALKKAAILEKTLQVLEEQCELHAKTTASRVKEAKFMRGKAREYAKTTLAYQTKLPQSYITHECLVGKAEALHELKNKLTPLKSRLNGYHSLPPNINLTKVRIEETRREIACVERELADIVAHI